MERITDGKDNNQIKLLSLFTVVDAKGNESNEGEHMRWIAESPCFLVL